MADENGTAALLHKKSVKKDDFATGNIQFVYPAYGYDSYLKVYPVLPRNLPAFNRWSFYTERDWIQLTTTRHEAMWANTIAIATTKAASWGWEVTGDVPLRRKRTQDLLMHATAGVLVGWVPFVSAHLRSYLLTGRAIVEIERQTGAAGSKIIGLHHLNPLRCRFTDNPRKPVEYLDRKGKIHVLNYWQVMMLVDNPDPTEGDIFFQESATERAYDRIATMEATHTFLYEKITGKRALSLEFIQGITKRHLEDAMMSSDADMERRGSIVHRGVVAIPIPGDVPVNRVTIPVAEVPDGFSYQEIHDNTLVDYCGATGMDVNDIDPRLAQKGGIGSGAQAYILHQKESGKGLAAWRVDWKQQVHRLVAGAATKFAFSETSLDDEAKKADNSVKRANFRKTSQEIGEIDKETSRSLAIDAGDLPEELKDQPMPKPPDEGKEGEKPPAPGQPKPKAAANGQKPPAPAKAPGQPKTPTQPGIEPVKEQEGGQAKKEKKEDESDDTETADLILENLVAVQKRIQDGHTSMKHLGSEHKQKPHGWRHATLGAAQRTAKRLPKDERPAFQERAMARLSGTPTKAKPKSKPAPKPKTAAGGQSTGGRSASKPKPVAKAQASDVMTRARQARGEVDKATKGYDKRISSLESKMAGTPFTKDKVKYQGEINKLKERRLARTRKILAVENPGDSGAMIDKRIKGDIKKRVTDGLEEFNNLVDASVMPGNPATVIPGGGRSFYRHGDNAVSLGPGRGSTVIVHEMGHWLEKNSPSIRKKTMDFLEKRTAGEASQSMAKATGNDAYRGSETTKKDKFISPYMGKEYFTSGGKRRSTEILSMGLEMFYDDPGKLARQDPGYFDFIFSVVRGG